MISDSLVSRLDQHILALRPRPRDRIRCPHFTHQAMDGPARVSAGRLINRNSLQSMRRHYYCEYPRIRRHRAVDPGPSHPPGTLHLSGRILDRGRQSMPWLERSRCLQAGWIYPRGLIWRHIRGGGKRGEEASGRKDIQDCPLDEDVHPTKV